MSGSIPPRRVVVVGAGAAGVFGAVACAEAGVEAGRAVEVSVFEATPHPLAKVRVSGGGRCNVTNACQEPRLLAANYPRGGREIVGPLTRFGPRETVAWFAGRGVALKAEADGRMFPVTDDSATVIGCLLGAAEKAGVRLHTSVGVRAVRRGAGAGGFTVVVGAGEEVAADRVLVATGGNRQSGGLGIAEEFGHAIEPPVPSLFTFRLAASGLLELAGLSVPQAALSVAGTKLRAEGPVLITHGGLSGPAVLRLSAWGAREFHEAGYGCTLVVNWAAALKPAEVKARLEGERRAHPKRRVATANPLGIPGRLWERLVVGLGRAGERAGGGASDVGAVGGRVVEAGLAADAVWAGVSNAALRALAGRVTGCELAVEGKSMNKEEFVTCGGVRLCEVDFATMESRLCPGLHFAGEVLDIDGITGGYNFQAAWTTGWHAGRAMAGLSP